MKHSVLLDTGFLIRLLKSDEPLHSNAVGYFKYFLENEFILKVSTISIAEYCVKGKIDDLPLKNLQIVPFNTNHAQRTGEFASIVFKANNIDSVKLHPRAIIPNDSKLFAQADIVDDIEYFVTADVRCSNIYSKIAQVVTPKFKLIDFNTPYGETFGVLEL